MVEPPDPEFTIVGDDRLSDSAIEALARLLIDEHPTDGHCRLSARVRPGCIPAAAIDHRSV